MSEGKRHQPTCSTDDRGDAGKVQWLYAFQVFNAMSFTLALGAPLVLAGRYIGATEFQIGALTALTPLLMVLQLVAANMLDRFGCRRLMMAGWGMRAMFLFFAVPLPLLVGRVPTGVLVGILFFAMFGFNVVRGFASAAWFPWLNHLVAEKERGRFFGVEQVVLNVSAFAALMIFGLFLGSEPSPWKYSVMFLMAALLGFVGVWFLGKAPEYYPNPRPRRLSKLSATITNLRIAWRYPPFRRTFRFVFLFTVAAFSFPAFLVLYQREVLGWGDGLILKLQSVMMLGTLTSAYFFGHAVDRLGSRPIIRLADLALLLFIMFWVASAGFAWKPTVLAAGLTFFLWGLMNAAHAVAQLRLTMGCCPPRHVAYSMAIFMVLTSLAGASAPILFGWLLMGGQRIFDDVATAYVMIFSLMFVLVAAAQFLLAAVPDPRAHSTTMVLQLAYGWPLRFLSSVRFKR